MAVGWIETSVLTDIANAIRAQNGTAATYAPSEMAAAVAALDGTKAGAAGVEGEAGIKDGSFVLKGGAAAGIGGSLGIEIGLSDEAQEAIGEVLDFFTFWD